ncbi:hypothetical protein BH11MYX2_BH11MYX2_07820 [soil metagenome]
MSSACAFESTIFIMWPDPPLVMKAIAMPTCVSATDTCVPGTCIEHMSAIAPDPLCGFASVAVDAFSSQRIADFAREWITSKVLSIDAGTARTYTKALAHHVLPGCEQPVIAKQ